MKHYHPIFEENIQCRQILIKELPSCTKHYMGLHGTQCPTPECHQDMLFLS